MERNWSDCSSHPNANCHCRKRKRANRKRIKSLLILTKKKSIQICNDNVKLEHIKTQLKAYTDKSISNKLN